MQQCLKIPVRHISRQVKTENGSSRPSARCCCVPSSPQPSLVAHKPPSHSGQQLDKKAEMNNSSPLCFREFLLVSKRPSTDGDKKGRRRCLLALAFSRHVWLPSTYLSNPVTFRAARTTQKRETEVKLVTRTTASIRCCLYLNFLYLNITQFSRCASLTQ